jgi:hypothetical protein
MDLKIPFVFETNASDFSFHDFTLINPDAICRTRLAFSWAPWWGALYRFRSPDREKSDPLATLNRRLYHGALSSCDPFRSMFMRAAPNTTGFFAITVPPLIVFFLRRRPVALITLPQHALLGILGYVPIATFSGAWE